MAAVRVSLTWFGTRKSLTAEQKAEAAEPFGAEAKFISAGKKLLDTKHPAFKAVTAVRGKVIAYWKSLSLPYPEPGIRLIRQQKIDAFAAQMREFQEQLAEAVTNLDRTLSRVEGHGPAAIGQPVQQRRLPGIARRLVRDQLRFPADGAAGVPSAHSTRRCMNRNASGFRAGSMKPCGWLRKPSPPNSPS